MLAVTAKTRNSISWAHILQQTWCTNVYQLNSPCSYRLAMNFLCLFPSIPMTIIPCGRYASKETRLGIGRCIILNTFASFYFKALGSAMQVLCKPIFRWGLLWKPNTSTMAWFAAWLGLSLACLGHAASKTERLPWQSRGLPMILQCDLPEGETQIPSVLDSNILNLRWCVHNYRVFSLNRFILSCAR